MSDRENFYQEAVATFGEAMKRLVRAYEADPAKQQDLLQDIHLALWLSFERFESRCSMRTWVYRVAHNTATSHVIKQRRKNPRSLLSLEEAEASLPVADQTQAADERIAFQRLLDLIHRLKPLERDVMLLYLEDLDAVEIAEITGISPGNVRVQIHRIKAILARQFHEGGG